MPTDSAKIVMAVAIVLVCLGIFAIIVSAIVKKKTNSDIPSFLEVWLKTKMPVILIAYFPLTAILGIVLIVTTNTVAAGIFFIVSVAVYFIASFIAVNITGRKMIKNRIAEEQKKREEQERDVNVL